LTPYLLSRRINCIDYIIFSHFDTDHVGGLKDVLENLKVKNIIISKQKEEYENFKDIMEIAQDKKINIIIVKAKDKVIFDETAYIDVLYPTAELTHSDINNNSIVAKFICNNVSILFTRRYRKGSRKKDIKFI
jgi:competence protein ComEC